MTRIALIGLGRMGAPIARRLANAGYDVDGYDLASTVTLASIVRTADVVMTILPGSSEFAAAAARIIAAGRPGTLWIDCTSNDPRTAETAARQAGESGIAFLGAPMGGGPTDAADGTLRFFASGMAVDPARAVLGCLGEIEYLGVTVGAGYTAKLIANLLWFGQVIAVSEALLLGQSEGLSPQTLRHILPTTAGGSTFIDRHLDHLLRGDYLETFGLDRIVDELTILEQLAAEGGIPFALSRLVARTHREARARFGPADGELLAAKLLEQKAGILLRDDSLIASADEIRP